jgi:hypothetical protein
MRYLFIFGMYRSGTTTLSKTIDCLDGVVVKNDAIFFWFKSIRNLLLKGNKKLKNSLFDHYLFDDNQIELFKRLQKIDINKKIFDKKFFIKNILKDTRKYQPGLERIILENKSKTYKNFIKFFLNEIAKEKKKIKYSGVKEVWLTEFYPILKKNFQNSKFIFIVRDPRAVIASSLFNKNSNYSISFLVNQWRKIATLSKMYFENDKKNVLIIKYEDFIGKFDQVINKIKFFLNIKTISKKKIISDLQNSKKWEQNSTYAYKKKNKFLNKKSIDYWKKKLTPEQIKLIEFILFEEMKIYKYKKIFIKKNSLYAKNNNLNFLDKQITKIQIQNEIDRKLILHNKKKFNKFYFLNKDAFKILKKYN